MPNTQRSAWSASQKTTGLGRPPSGSRNNFQLVARGRLGEAGVKKKITRRQDYLNLVSLTLASTSCRQVVQNLP
jgi:hypothetical protein